MPQEHKKRGRRMNKRKHGEDDEDNANLEPVIETNKRRKSAGEDETESQQPYIPLAAQDSEYDAGYPSTVERPFFGMLDEEEQEYFKRADDMLETNAFGDADERKLFLESVYREAEGKELKIALSQSCSRLMERLIQLSSAAQLKNLFQKFSGNFAHIVTHRFGSHCCEALFLYAAPYVTEELLAPAPKSETTDAADIYVSMENLYLHTLAELEGSIGFLMTDTYASHVLRVLLLVFAGEPLDSDANKHLLQSKRKETVLVQDPNLRSLEKSRTVPEAFSEALNKLISDSVAGLDTANVRALATHPNANPTLQLLLKLELTHFGKQRAKDETSIIRTLLPDDPITAESGSAAFINGLVYDAVGSHLIEKIIDHAPGKMYLYREFFRDRLCVFAKNEVAGYVVCRALERMSKDDLYEAHEALIPALSDLLERNRTTVVRTLIERCVKREVDTQAIAAQIDLAYRVHCEFDIKRFLKFGQSKSETDAPQKSVISSSANASDPTGSRSSEPAKAHFNILAQSMLLASGSLSSLIMDGLISCDTASLLQMSKDHIVSRTIQGALTTPHASIIERRKLIQHFYGSIGDMTSDKAASHVVDCIWEGTHGLAFIRERVAEELAEDEASLRDTQHGRAVWKNWKMDMYKRKRPEWIRQSQNKASNDGFQTFSELDSNQVEAGEVKPKTPLQLARERHSAKKAAESKGKSKPPPAINGHGQVSGANATVQQAPAATASS